MDSQTPPSLAVISDFDSNVTMEEGRSQLSPTASVLGVTNVAPLAKSAASANDNNSSDNGVVGRSISEI